MNPISIPDIREGKYGMPHSVRLDAIRVGGLSTTASAPLRFWRDNHGVGCSLLHFPTFSDGSALLSFLFIIHGTSGGSSALVVSMDIPRLNLSINDKVGARPGLEEYVGSGDINKS